MGAQGALLQRVEMLGYCDGKASVDWITGVGGKVLNLLTKGSEKHCREQLGKTPEQHRAAIDETVRYARRKRLSVNVYLEDWFSGVRDAFDYVFAMVEKLRELRVERIYLADTLGTLAPEDVTRYVGLMRQPGRKWSSSSTHTTTTHSLRKLPRPQLQAGPPVSTQA